MKTDRDPPIRLDIDPAQERTLRATSRLRAIRARNEERYRHHPWPYLCEAVHTHDPLARGAEGGGVRKYPGASIRDPAPMCRCQQGGCTNYLHHIVNIWFKTQRMVFPKSRRLILSWTFVALHEWLARYRESQVIAFVSRKQGQNDSEGSAELVQRAKFIGEHLPVEVQPREVTSTWCRLKYPHTNSVIVGIGQGADQLRQLTVTAWFADEFAFWEWAGETYAASLPALEGGGRFTAVSSANPGFMKQLVFDEWHTGG